MNFSFLMSPFKWFVLGIIAIFTFLINIIKNIVKIIVLLFKYIYMGIKKTVVFMAKGIKKLFIILFSGVKKLFILLFKGVKKLVALLSKIIIYLIKFIGLLLKWFFIGIKKILIAIFLALKFIFIYLFKGLKIILLALYKAISFIVKYIYRGFRIVFIALYKVLRYLGMLLINGIISVLKLLSKIPLFIWFIMKSIGLLLYKILVYPFVYLYKNAKSIIDKALASIKKAITDALKFIGSIPIKIKNAIVDWYSNLSFVKDIRNRREMKRQKLLIDFEGEDAVRSAQKVMYRYVAKNPNGKIEKGFLNAYSRLDVHSYLLAEEYEVYEIEVYKGINIKFGSSYKIKHAELAFFLTQLSTYIKAGIPLVDSIKILTRQAREKSKRDLFKSVVYELTMGDNFSEALEKQGVAFPRLLVNMIKSAELAGNLAETLDDMSNYYDTVSKTKKQMLSAMMYPLVILSFATLVLVFIMIYVIPEFVSIYKGMDTGLPGITQAVISLSDFLSENIIYLALGLFAFIALFAFMYKKVKFFKTIIQWIIMHIPVAGNIIIYNEVTMFAKTFGSLLNHSVFITDSMEILSKITNNEVYKMLIFDTITNLAKGDSISKSFKNHWAFPIVAYEMLVTGERTGQPGPMMNKVADYYQEEHKNAINQVKVFLEPVMIIFLAVVVGIILLSVILPMFNLYGNLGLE